MSDAAQKKKATYEDILSLPETVIGEIIGGELVVSPRPSGPHIVTAAFLTSRLNEKFSFGKGGSSGWWILAEPEVQLEEETEHYVPDLAGWRRERMPKVPDGHIFTVVPDWICEILSPSNMRNDRIKKVPQYAAHGVKHLWLVNPRDKLLETFRLENKHWVLIKTFGETEKVRAEPFEELEIDLGTVWGG